ncbi:LmbE family N-acetylglucosaminyl deacetylase [Desulfitispora alkaliphila]|uniref:PIG-L deacetylase family protein n=1 Tax=Desulfitispora alkaliphila TaxID=622674 RepID=UPI003D1992C1
MKISKPKIYTGIIGVLVFLGIYLVKEIRQQLVVSANQAVDNGRDLVQSKASVLAVTAHPDDLEIFMGGTLKLLALGGARVNVVCVSDGEKGVNKIDLRNTRQREQRKAADILKVSNLEFLHQPDLKLAQDKNLLPLLSQVIRQVQPQLIFAFDPTYPLGVVRRHPDHIAVGKAVAKLHKKLYPGTDIYFYATSKANTVVDISETLLSKQRALRCHKSQLRFNDRIYNEFVKIYAKYCARGTKFKYSEVYRKGDT